MQLHEQGLLAAIEFAAPVGGGLKPLERLRQPPARHIDCIGLAH